MKTSIMHNALVCLALYIRVTSPALAQTTGNILLQKDWAIQSSEKITAKGDLISTTSFKPESWYPATVPSTIVGILVDNKVYPDPYFGTNIETLPGYSAEMRKGMPENSPFKVPWWYRTVFKLPADYKGRNVWIKFHSINYRANIWLNGHLIADTSVIEGAYRLYNLNVGSYAFAGGDNCLAVEIFPPKGMDLTITWVDWNPTPPDRGLGIWYDIDVHATGPVALENPRVITKLNLPQTNQAKLTVSSDVFNATDKAVTGIVKGRIGDILFSREITLAPNERKVIRFDPGEYKQLEIANPRLWWPHTVGPQNLYELNLSFDVKGKVSDQVSTRFGIREITSWMNEFDDKHTRVFQVNGKNIVVRGGGYVQDMMLRPSDERTDIDIMYAKHMGLNALRMEAPRGSDHFFEKCDEEGIMLIVGWCCCSAWERWKSWTPHTADIAEKSWHDQVVHLRNHPSVIDWLYGSDNFPPAEIEKRYIRVLDEEDGTRPYQSSATQSASEIAGYTGLWMGPYPKVYAYSVPSYWYGKLEFNTEAGPAGEQISPVESLRKMMPESDLWPISKSWDIRLHKAFYPEARKALESRYGKPEKLDEYIMKSQVLQLEATKAMFEAYAGNKYKSSGIIYWMYNSAWPSLYWQLYDYFFTPNGSFYGAKKACETLHIQYAYNDSSVYVVNGFYNDFKGLKAEVSLFDFDLKQLYHQDIFVDISADESRKVVTPEKPPVQGVYFLKLNLTDATGNLISTNFYWLSSKGDVNADFTALGDLAQVEVKCTPGKPELLHGNYKIEIQFENQSASLAFFINPKIVKNRSKDLVLPVYWEDNYFSLLPGEKRKLRVEFKASDLDGEHATLVLEGWNIKPEVFALY